MALRQRISEAVMLGALGTLSSHVTIATQQPNVMDSTLSLGTIRRLDPGHPTLSNVTTTRTGNTLTIEGALDAPTASFAPTTPEYRLCQSPGARCAQFEVTLPSGTAWQGRRELAVREEGTTVWRVLATRRSMLAQGVFVDEFEEFHGFSIGPIFATVNCDVSNREKTSWAVRLWTQKTVSFRISLDLKRCATSP